MRRSILRLSPNAVELPGGSSGDPPATVGAARWLIPTAVLILSIMPFLSALWAGFTNWDDPNNIIENLGFRAFKLENFQWMWTTQHLGVYEPFGWMLKAAIYAVGGLNPAAFHAASLILHAANVWLVYVIALRLLRRAMPSETGIRQRWGAAIAALAFGLHPLRSEVVVWASGQPYLLSSFFALLAAWIYLRTFDAEIVTARRQIIGLTLCTLVYAMGVLSKTAALPLPAVLLLLDIYPLRRLPDTKSISKLLIEKIPLFAVAIGLAYKAQSIGTISNIDPSLFSLLERFELAAYSVWFCISKTLWPVDHSPFYALPFPYTGLTSAYHIGAACGAAMTVVALMAVHRRPAVTVAWLAFLLWLAPASGFVRHGDQYGADRYAYISCISLAILLGGACIRFARSSRMTKRVGAGVLAALLLTEAGLATRQSWIWGDSGRLWEHAVAVDPENWVGVNNLANYYLESGNLSRAFGIASAGTARWPTYHDLIMTKGLVYEQREQYTLSVAEFERALALKPDSDVVSNLAADLRKLGRGAEGIDLLKKKAARSPNDLRTIGNLGTILIDDGRFAEAVPYIQQAVKLQTRSAELHFKLGLACAGAKQFKEAEQAFNRVTAIKPDYPRLQFQLASLYARMNRKDAAIAGFRTAIKADPSDVESHLKLGGLLTADGHDAEAVKEWTEALRLAPGNVTAMNSLAWLLAASDDAGVRDGAEALRLAQELVRLTRRRQANALLTLAAARAAVGQFAEATQAAEEARNLAAQDTPLASRATAALIELAAGRPLRGPIP